MKKRKKTKNLPVPHEPTMEGEVVGEDKAESLLIFDALGLQAALAAATKRVGGVIVKTPTQLFDECMACDTMEKMQTWFEKTVGELALAGGRSVTKTEKFLREMLGYMTGSCPDGPDQLEYLYNWLDIKHPVFGTPTQMRKVTPQKAIEAGIEWALKQKSSTEKK